MVKSSASNQEPINIVQYFELFLFNEYPELLPFLAKSSAYLDWAVSGNYNVNFLTKVHKKSNFGQES